MKRYVAVGINAYPTAPLAGCVNDAFDWSTELERRGFTGDRILNEEATGDRILDTWRAALGNSERGDTVILTFSGHGTWTPDRDGDEPDRRDEALVPVDYAETGLILDDDLHELFTEHRPAGVNVLLLADSCHSGNVHRAFAGNLDSTLGVARYLPPSEALIAYGDNEIARAIDMGRATTRTMAPPRTTAALMTACRPDQVAYDAWFGDRPNGAFTHAALETLRRQNPRTLNQWTAHTIAQVTADGYDQQPTVSGNWRQRNMTKWLR